ncbi:Trm112 family protein [Nanoarchaeota archaeon]
MPDPIPKEIFDLYVCPVCKARLQPTDKGTGVQCSQCKIKYPVEDGIPILLPPKV